MFEERTFSKNGLTIKNGNCRHCMKDFDGNDWFCSPECKEEFFKNAKVMTVLQVGDKNCIVYSLYEESIIAYNGIVDEYEIIPYSANLVVALLADYKNTFNAILQDTCSENYSEVIRKVNDKQIVPEHPRYKDALNEIVRICSGCSFKSNCIPDCKNTIGDRFIKIAKQALEKKF